MQSVRQAKRAHPSRKLIRGYLIHMWYVIKVLACTCNNDKGLMSLCCTLWKVSALYFLLCKVMDLGQYTHTYLVHEEKISFIPVWHNDISLKPYHAHTVQYSYTQSNISFNHISSIATMKHEFHTNRSYYKFH